MFSSKSFCGERRFPTVVHSGDGARWEEARRRVIARKKWPTMCVPQRIASSQSKPPGLQREKKLANMCALMATSGITWERRIRDARQPACRDQTRSEMLAPWIIWRQANFVEPLSLNTIHYGTLAGLVFVLHIAALSSYCETSVKRPERMVLKKALLVYF